MVDHSYGSAPSGIMEPPVVILPDPQVFSRRGRRLRELVALVPSMDEFLDFMARLVQAQHQVLEAREPDWRPAPNAFDAALEHGLPPLGFHALWRDLEWQRDLRALLDALDIHVGERQRPLLCALRTLSAAELDGIAENILAARPGSPDNRGLMPLVAAALQVTWVRLALHLPHPPGRPVGEARSLCPCCGSEPVASVVHSEAHRSGVRYLHCSLCATEWHVERVKCTVCDHSGQLLYLGLDGEDGKPFLPAQAEACQHCNSYLKIVPREFNQTAEPLADDLASLALDLLMDEQGEYARSGYNPLLIPGD